ncbi:hypothetical protein LTR10_021264 [Elasticomyces elasticus]|uniref:Uncharacterized protein n=1 Tax=Exophiala sideris TaxID=1016849 RepID=A0ABR0JG05_9EURO|nr:hypothetical protein LTR10_021264 [Elasticomyces elasticus]KAK5025377.1 hypothetical protein LTS07_008228 [Exophiala sideris]KAK5032952.1 hypothetical protein LTR13_006917 [Exophiala sideris]KAK5063437.1 hypothetical protein LTR69_004143 [Exophiala sideris]KAK5180731.1 hypothetical protein LTR44_007045 [Eurotiomycetes sp. CCFEE 6388]
MVRTKQACRKRTADASRASLPAKDSQQLTEDFVNELLGAFQSQQHPWKSNLGFINAIIEDIWEHQGPIPDGQYIEISQEKADDGENRYNARVEEVNREDDMDDFKDAMAEALTEFNAFKKAETKKLQKRTKRSADDEIEAWRALNQSLEVLDEARKRVKVRAADDEEDRTEADKTEDDASSDDDSESDEHLQG